MKFSSLILSVLLSSTLSGQALAQKSPGLGELTVRVKSSEGPVEGASVVLTSRSAGQRLNVTNAEGVCEFRALQTGSYSLQVVQRGFFPTEEPEKHLEIGNGQSQSVSFYFVKGGVLKGRVVSTDGSPIIGMPITVLKLAGKQPLLPSGKESNVTGISDDRGEFRIYGLRSGTYTVAVNAQRSGSPLKSFATLFYPGERQIANATTFDLVSGQEIDVLEMVLDLTRANQNSLVGVVRERNGKALKGVSLSLLSIDGLQISDSSVSDTSGYFNFEGLPPGEYWLKASFSGRAYFDLKRQISIEDLAVNNVTLELARYPLISGRAYLRSATEVSSLPSLKLQLEPAQSGNKEIELVTDKDGNFSERSSKGGVFWWTFPELQGSYYVNRIMLDGKDITHRPVELDQASDRRGIVVEISPGAAEIRGLIHTGSCQQSNVYVVALHSKSNEIQFVRKANCSADSFRLQSLAPGRYYVVEVASGDLLDHCKRQPCTRQRGLDDKHYDAIEQVITILRTTGTKALTLNRNQIQDNIQPVRVDPKIVLTIK